MTKALFCAAIAAVLGGSLSAQTVIDVDKAGAEKLAISVNVGDPVYQKTLTRNLTLSGAFKVMEGAPIQVTGAAGGAITAKGRGKSLTVQSPTGDEKARRMAARAFSDKLCETYANQKGFATAPIAFVNKNGKSGELCTGYADGSDVRRLTRDGKASVGPRWKDANTLFYTGYLNEAPQIFEINAQTGARKLKWSFRGLTTGAVISPDANLVAIVLSVHGNPELYVIDPASDSWRRLTKTPKASEGQPAWSPDGKKIVYVSDETRRQHLYIIDVASKATRRITTQGTQNVDPDWGKDGRICYVSKRAGGRQIAVIEPAKGDREARLVTSPGNWEHPTWARDGRHIVAESDGVLYLIDTEEGGDAPRQLFKIAGRAITPSWSK